MKDIVQYALKLVNLRARTEEELRRKLLAKGYSAEDIAQIMPQLKEQGIINDSSYAEIFASYLVAHKPSGKIILRARMRARGIPTHYIDRELSGIDRATECDMARAIVRRKLRLGKCTRDRMGQLLNRKGFPPDIIFELLDELYHASDEEVRKKE